MKTSNLCFALYIIFTGIYSRNLRKRVALKANQGPSIQAGDKDFLYWQKKKL